MRQLGHSGPLGRDVDADVRSQRWCLPVGETPRATTNILSMPTHHIDDLDIYGFGKIEGIEVAAAALPGSVAHHKERHRKDRSSEDRSGPVVQIMRCS